MGEKGLKKLIKPIGYLLMGIFCARCDFLEGMYPLGIALLSITYLSKNYFYIYLGAVIGAISINFVPSQMLINTLSYGLFLPCALYLKQKKTEKLVF